MIKINKLKKTAIAMVVMATMFSHCNVMAAESNKNVEEEVQVFESTDDQEEKSTKGSTKKEIKAVNNRIDELNQKLEEQQVMQKKIIEMLENMEFTKVKGASEEMISYNSAALVNPSKSRRVNYTQDGANSQDNSTVIFKYAPNQLYIVVGMQNYYRIATHISKDMHKLNWAVMTVITRRLKGISRKGRELTPAERIRYGKSEMLRYLADEPIYPIGYVQNKIPMSKSSKAKEATNDDFKLKLIKQPLYCRSIEYADNRISLYSAQKGRCAITGEKFTSAEEIHCHHKIPKFKGGTDEYQNLILVTATVHKLIHATNAETIQKYLKICKPDMKKLNVLRKEVGNNILSVD